MPDSDMLNLKWPWFGVSGHFGPSPLVSLVVDPSWIQGSAATRKSSVTFRNCLQGSVTMNNATDNSTNESAIALGARCMCPTRRREGEPPTSPRRPCPPFWKRKGEWQLHKEDPIFESPTVDAKDCVTLVRFRRLLAA